jgi:hypothetical protein
MTGQETERLLALIETNTTLSREELLAYIEKNKEHILAELEAKGEAEIPVPGGEKIVLRRAA